ncbi:hypothetical protein [Empedobacter sp.]|uniref:hypothetical protein n=1 Tax=Empedobacter sp. TaxID=1927715 RepID=UPI0028A1BAD8|nr:hypothetical protein [Empedobacter sp.]
MENVTRLEQLKPKMQMGDFDLVAEMINAPSREAAKMRLRRGDEQALNALKTLIEKRESIVKEFQNDNNQ